LANEIACTTGGLPIEGTRRDFALTGFWGNVRIDIRRSRCAKLYVNLSRISMKMAGVLLTLTLLALAALSGCCNKIRPECFVKDARPGLTSYGAAARECRSIQINGQMAWDDFDHFWMIDRPSTLNWLRVNRY
jgi:hypothetical protein